MCGIAGIYNLDHRPVDRNALIRFTDSMRHRGPDGSAYDLFDNESLGLAQRRLAILDLSDSGRQPMSATNGRYTITYNGEIFNFLEIRNELKKLGHVFHSDTDTEVILASYREWGAACLNRFNGMWAFAVWDDQNKELFLARDRFGIKPLYYVHRNSEQFAFASETRAFKFLDGFSREIDQALLDHCLSDPYALEGLGYTLYKQIHQILPGHCMIVKRNSGIGQKRWWNIKDHIQEVPGTYEEQTEKFYELFKDSCRMRLISDVPVATALSGGLDSSSVYSTVYSIMNEEHSSAQKHERMSSDAQRAFTAVFPGLPNDEKEYAAIAAEFTKGQITYIDGTDQDLASRIERETELCDFISSSPISSISRVYEGMRKNGVIVSMDGHGVDEMMYGYRDMVYSLYNDALWNKRSTHAGSIREVLENMYHPDQNTENNAKFALQMQEKNRRDSSVKGRLKRLLGSTAESSEYTPVKLAALSDKPYDFSRMPLEERMVYNEFFQHTLPALLRNFDRAGMINSVEIRMPFMDWRLVSYVFSLPLTSKIGHGYTKRILRDAMKDKMDDRLIRRRYKVGISSPVETWMNGPLREWSMDHLKKGDLRSEAEKILKSGDKWNSGLVRSMWQEINLKLIQ